MRFLSALLIVGIPLGASADIYECRSADGDIHFTNIRQRGHRCRLIVRESKAPRPRRRSQTRQRNSRPDPARYQRYDTFIREAAELYQLPEPFLRAIMRVESDFNPQVVSHAGAMGLMQLMPRTAASMGVVDPFDPRQNILGGARFLRILANRFNGDLILTIAAYNAGEGAVRRYHGVPPYQDTQRYVRRVLDFYYSYRSQTSG